MAKLLFGYRTPHVRVSFEDAIDERAAFCRSVCESEADQGIFELGIGKCLPNSPSHLGEGLFPRRGEECEQQCA